VSEILHNEERRQFERLLRQMRMDRLGDRLSLVEVFLTSEEHHTAEGWQRLLKERGVDLEPRFVRETLEILTRFGLAMRREFEGEPARYEHHHLDEHHDHLICTGCGSITEFANPQLEALQEQIAKEQGFHCLRHRHQIYGLCRKCLANRQPTMPLALAAPGEKVRIERIVGGDMVCHHLSDLGLCVGQELEVISGNDGPMVVALRGSRVALGRGAAQKVMVSPIKDASSRKED